MEYMSWLLDTHADFQRVFVLGLGIHSPKLIGGSSELGASPFKLEYNYQPACLAQSPQSYKQMSSWRPNTQSFYLLIFYTSSSWRSGGVDERHPMQRRQLPYGRGQEHLALVVFLLIVVIAINSNNDDRLMRRLLEREWGRGRQIFQVQWYDNHVLKYQWDLVLSQHRVLSNLSNTISFMSNVL